MPDPGSGSPDGGDVGLGLKTLVWALVRTLVRALTDLMPGRAGEPQIRSL